MLPIVDLEKCDGWQLHNANIYENWLTYTRVPSRVSSTLRYDSIVFRMAVLFFVLRSSFVHVNVNEPQWSIYKLIYVSTRMSHSTIHSYNKDQKVDKHSWFFFFEYNFRCKIWLVTLTHERVEGARDKRLSLLQRRHNCIFFSCSNSSGKQLTNTV